MNYFFFTFTDEISAEISVPKFRNDGQYAKNMDLYGANVVDNSWCFYPAEVDESSNFWNIVATEENRNDIFFIATPEQFELQSKSESLIYLNDFTKTWPDFRCNLSVANSQGGFSSYQSEYPFIMVAKKGSLYSSIATLSISDAQKNLIFVRNIYSQPITDKYLAYLYDSCNEEVLNKIELQTNCTNVIEISEYSQCFEHLYLRLLIDIKIILL